MRTLTVTLTLLLALVALPHPARAADGASIHAILIIASKEKAPADPRLAPYEATLQRNLPESSFRFAGEDKASLSAKKNRAEINLGGGHVIGLEGGTRDANGIQVKVRWLKGKTTVMTNSFVFQPGVPIVLGQRPSGDGDVPIVILLAR